MKRKRKIKYLVNKAYRRKTFGIHELVTGCVVISDASIFRRKNDQSVPNATIHWESNPAEICVHHYSYDDSAVKITREWYKVSLKEDFVNNLKDEKSKILDKFKLESYRIRFLHKMTM